MHQFIVLGFGKRRLKAPVSIKKSVSDKSDDSTFVCMYCDVICHQVDDIISHVMKSHRKQKLEYHILAKDNTEKHTVTVDEPGHTVGSINGGERNTQQSDKQISKDTVSSHDETSEGETTADQSGASKDCADQSENNKQGVMWQCRLCSHEEPTKTAQTLHLEAKHKVIMTAAIEHLCIKQKNT